MAGEDLGLGVQPVLLYQSAALSIAAAGAHSADNVTSTAALTAGPREAGKEPVALGPSCACHRPGWPAAALSP